MPNARVGSDVQTSEMFIATRERRFRQNDANLKPELGTCVIGAMTFCNLETVPGGGMSRISPAARSQQSSASYSFDTCSRRSSTRKSAFLPRFSLPSHQVPTSS